MPSYSVIDNNIPIDHKNWVIAIMRKPQGDNPEHAFLMVEGETSFGKVILKRYDLFVDENSLSNKVKALIYIKPEVVTEQADARTALLDDLLKGEEVYSISWSITRSQAELLHQDILQDKSNPPDYQVSGDKSLVAKSSSNEGHSCFTWAREKLHNLNDPRVQLPEKYTDFIAAKTSRYIKGNPEPSSLKCQIM